MAYAIRRDIFDVPFIQRKYNPARPGGQVFVPDNPADDQKYSPWNVFTHLNRCCVQQNCVRNLIDFPQRLEVCETFTFCESDVGTYYPGFCLNCHLPKPCHESFKFITVDYVHKLENWLRSEGGWTELDEYSDTSIVYFCVQLRRHARFGDVEIRRNHANVLIVHPYQNLYRFVHITFRFYRGRIGPHNLITRILKESLLNVENDIDYRMPAHCTCVQRQREVQPPQQVQQQEQQQQPTHV